MKDVSYQDFGAAFIDEAVTPARIEAAVLAVAGGAIEVGPMGVGPGDAASVLAEGTVGGPTARPAASAPDGTRRFVVSIPVELHLTVKVAGTLHRFEAGIVARLHLSVRTALEPLALVIEIAPPEGFDLEVDVRSSAMTSKVLGRLGNIDGKIRKEVVGFITERLNGPDAKAATTINIADHIEAVWK